MEVQWPSDDEQGGAGRESAFIKDERRTSRVATVREGGLKRKAEVHEEGEEEDETGRFRKWTKVEQQRFVTTAKDVVWMGRKRRVMAMVEVYDEDEYEFEIDEAELTVKTRAKIGRKGKGKATEVDDDDDSQECEE